MKKPMNHPVHHSNYKAGAINKDFNQSKQPHSKYNYKNENMDNFNIFNPKPPHQQQMINFDKNWKEHISPITNFKIKQVFDNKEFVSDFVFNVNLDFKNKYLVIDASTDIINFLVHENSHFLWRNCLPKICIPSNMNILKYGKELNARDVVIEKDFSCTFLCFNRPTIKVYDVSKNNNKELTGTIKYPFSCCSYKYNIFDASNNKIFYVNDSCCQLSLICPLPCGACQYSNFYLNDAKTKEKVAHLRKEVPLLHLVKSDIDYYELNLEKVISPELKIMVLAFTLYLDYMNFDYKN